MSYNSSISNFVNLFNSLKNYESQFKSQNYPDSILKELENQSKNLTETSLEIAKFWDSQEIKKFKNTLVALNKFITKETTPSNSSFLPFSSSSSANTLNLSNERIERIASTKLDFVKASTKAIDSLNQTLTQVYQDEANAKEIINLIAANGVSSETKKELYKKAQGLINQRNFNMPSDLIRSFLLELDITFNKTKDPESLDILHSIYVVLWNKNKKICINHIETLTNGILSASRFSSQGLAFYQKVISHYGQLLGNTSTDFSASTKNILDKLDMARIKLGLS